VKTTRLMDIARILRSKNAGAFVLTIDVIFKNQADYDAVMESGAICAEAVERLYRVPAKDVLITPYPQVHAIKVTMPRSIGSGDVSDSDVYGSQQHVPLMLLEVAAAQTRTGPAAGAR